MTDLIFAGHQTLDPVADYHDNRLVDHIGGLDT
jgi:hypothetical protein